MQERFLLNPPKNHPQTGNQLSDSVIKAHSRKKRLRCAAAANLCGAEN